MNPMRGERVADYEISEHLGTGGMGQVYQAADTKIGRPAASKILPGHLPQADRVVARSHREARAASALNHPHICKIYDIGEHRGKPYLVMELLEGETLKDRLKRGRVPVTDLLEIAVEIADALDAAHHAAI